MAAEARAHLLEELRRHAVLRGEFILSSGQTSSYYLDARRITLSAEGSGLVGEVFLAALPVTGVDAVAGLSIGADPIVVAIAVVAGQRGRSIDGIIVRKKMKSHGTGQRLEGPWRTGRRVAIVDDTLTTGSSALQAAEAVEAEGGRVVGIYALIDRGQGAKEAIQAAGYTFHPIFSVSEVLGT